MFQPNNLFGCLKPFNKLNKLKYASIFNGYLICFYLNSLEIVGVLKTQLGPFKINIYTLFITYD